MLKKLNKIFIGWGKALGWLPTSLGEKKMSDLRMLICKKCDKGKESKALKIVNGHGVYETELYCTKCTCPVYQKSLVAAENCPLSKW